MVFGAAMKRQKPSTLPQPRSIAMAAGFAMVANLAASASPYMGYGLALATMVLIGVQAFGLLAIWPDRKRREHPVAFAVFWGLMLGLVVPGMVETIQEEGLAGWWQLLFSTE